MTHERRKVTFVDRSDMIDHRVQTVHVIAQRIVHLTHERFHIQFERERNERRDFLIDLTGMFESFQMEAGDNGQRMHRQLFRRLLVHFARATFDFRT